MKMSAKHGKQIHIADNKKIDIRTISFLSLATK